MSNMGKSIRGNRWMVVMALGLMVPNFALAAKGKAAPPAQQSCESQASVSYNKKAVEVAMASIMGDLSELEATAAREGLQRRLEVEKATCLHVARAGTATTGSL